MTEHISAHPRSLIMPPGVAHSYPLSRADRLMAWIDSLWFPAWMFYLIIWLILLGIEVLIQWHDGTYPVGTVPSLHLFYTATLPYGLCAIHYLDKWAFEALGRFRPAMDLDDDEYVELCYRFTNMPPRGAMRATFIALLVTIALMLLVPVDLRTHLLILSDSPLSLGFNALLSLATWTTMLGPVFYHSMHHLRMVDYIYTKHTRINLFSLRPLYALSGLLLRGAIALVLVAYAWFATGPDFMSAPVTIGLGLFCVIVAGLVFFSPLVGIHQLLLAEKGRLLAECRARIGAITAELHRRVDSMTLEEMDSLNKALISLDLERAALDRIPTWPWQPETLRNVIAALLFPLVVWLIQNALRHFFA